MKINPVIKMGIVFFKSIPERRARIIIRKLNALRLYNVYRLKIPRTMTLFLTNRCNASCRHCFYWKKVSEVKAELSLSEIQKLLKTIRGVKTINLTGGEPFLRDDLIDIVRMCVASGIKTISIPTNGILTERITYFANKMIKTPGLSMLKINISLDGPENTHDTIRNVIGCYEKAMKTIENLKDTKQGAKNFQVSVATVVSQDNLQDMETFIPKLFQLNLPLIISMVRGSEYHTYGISRELKQDMNPKDSKFLTSDADLDKFKEIIDTNASIYGVKNWNIFQQIKSDLFIDIVKHRKKRVDCLAGHLEGVIFNNGDVALCEYTKPVGNLRDVDMDFGKVWWSDTANRMRKYKKNCVCTHSCHLVSNMQYDPNLITKIIRNYGI
jgi:MoaA/NifB/PqqE/SkfB family radical SAM enzyme